MSNLIPEKTIAWNVYDEDSNVLFGVASCELPEVNLMKETISGAGIAGEYESPTPGHTESMTAKLTFRTKTKEALGLFKAGVHHLDLRASQQRQDGGTGAFANVAEKIVLRGATSGSGLGKLETGKVQDNEVSLSITYLKTMLGGEDILEIDKLNYKFVVNGEDQLAGVRSDLGLEA